MSQKGPFLKQPTVSAPPHSSLGYLSPVEFEHQWLAQQGVLEVVHQLHHYLLNIHMLPDQVSHLNPVLQPQLPNNYFQLVPHRKGREAQPLGNLLVG